MSLSPVIIRPSAVHTATLIFLHGLGDTGHGWASILQSVLPPHCKLVCPHAPTIGLTVYGGERMPAWFDVLVRGPTHAEQEPASVARSRDWLERLLTEEASALASVGGGRRCLLGGFSQGGALAMYTGLTSERWGRGSLAGLIGLSCYLPLYSQLQEFQATSLAAPPVFLAHGDADSVVRLEMGDAARRLMQERLGVTDLRFHLYPGLEHCAGDQELEDLKEFIFAMLPEKVN